MNTQIQCWKDTLATITQPEAWIGLRDGKAKLAEEVLARYDPPNDWIGHSFAARMSKKDGKDLATKTDAARRAERKRDAVLQLAFVHELAVWQARQTCAAADILPPLAKAMCQAASSSPVGLRPRADFASGDRASAFFQDALLPRIRAVDEKMGSAISAPLEQLRYDPANQVVWARAWTAAAALIPLEWARQRRLHTPREIAWALWCEVDSEGKPLPRFRPRAAIIPTASKLARAVHLDLVTRPAAAFALGRSHEIRDMGAQGLCGVSISLHELDYESNFGEARYRGRNVLQLYLTVAADCLHEANKDAPMGELDRSPADAGPGDGGDPSALPEEHRRALGHLSAARESHRAIRQAASRGKRFVPSNTIPVSGGGTTRMVAQTTIEWELLVLSARDFIAAEAEAEARWQPLGTVRLWHELGPDLDWVDILFVARIGDQHIRLPITMEDEVPDDDDAERSLLVLDTEGNPPVGAAALRSAFESPDAVVGVVIRKGLGAFVVVEIDMKAPQPDGLVF